jgi:hypothetical protein
MWPQRWGTETADKAQKWWHGGAATVPESKNGGRKVANSWGAVGGMQLGKASHLLQVEYGICSRRTLRKGLYGVVTQPARETLQPTELAQSEDVPPSALLVDRETGN